MNPAGADLGHPLATRKKPVYPLGDGIRSYLFRHGRETELPISYQRLLDFTISVPLTDRQGNDTLWLSVGYPPEEMKQISDALTRTYAILKTNGDYGATEHLFMDRIDFCTFGNSKPFRIRIVNAHNENQDYYYIKQADASRVYGLELEHLLSPNRMHYLTYGQTLVEEHVIGVPGDIFIKEWLKNPQINRVRLAKELVKFNERAFIRLLGDMRSYNFVLSITPDFEDFQIRIRPLDFDQQSYSGRKQFYLPQYFKDNNPLVFFCMNVLTPTSAFQYQREEHAMLIRRIQLVHKRIRSLLSEMAHDRLSTPEKVAALRESLAEHYENDDFLYCINMGEILRESLMTLIARNNRPSAAALSLY
ncbi:MAG: hypothetical protein ACFCU4_07155 [Puniceicoccaceae bacterium]